VASTRRILVVDDDSTIRKLLSSILTLNGYEVSTASNGAEALDRVAVFQPDMIILDNRMPIMDGPTFIKIYRKISGCSTPIILISGSQYLTKMAVTAHVQECLLKPFDVDELLGYMNCSAT
jgi:two-component system, OmpR family, response regulator MprA